MATTQTRKPTFDRWGDGWLITVVDLTTPEMGVGVNVAHGGPDGVEPDYVTVNEIVRATSRSVPHVAYVRGSNNTTNNTAYIVPDTEVGGSLSGATIRVFFHFSASASGGVS